MVVPVFLPVQLWTDAPSRVTMHNLGPQWTDWMLHHFATVMSPLRSTSSQVSDVLNHLADDGPECSVPEPD